MILIAIKINIRLTFIMKLTFLYV